MLTVSFVASADGAGQWVEQGPLGILNAQVNNIDPISTDPKNPTFRDPVAGAVAALALFNSPTTSGNRGAFAATVNGGIWKTDNITVENPHWQPMTDKIAGKSFASIAIFPGNTSDHDIVYAGTADLSSGHISDALGIFRSINGGQNWKRLSVSYLDSVADSQGNVDEGTFVGDDVRKIVIPKSLGDVANDGATVLAATSAGLLESSTGGEDIGTGKNRVPGWTRVFGHGLPEGAVDDLVEVKSADGTKSQTFFVALHGQGVFRSNDLLVWTNVTPTNQTFTGLREIKLSVSGQGNSARVYAALNETTSVTRLNGATAEFSSQATLKTTVFSTSNLGTSWTSLGAPTTNEDVDGNGTFESTFFLHSFTTQSHLHFSLAADPTNPDIVYIGGDTQPIAKTTASGTHNARLFRYTTAGGWQQIVGSATGDTSPHSDSRSITVYAQGGTTHLFETDDGGIFHLSDPSGTTGRWTSRIGPLDGTKDTLGINEVWSVAYDRLNNRFFIGAQDNGSSLQSSSRLGPWSLTSFGDGSFQAFDTGFAGEAVRYSMGNPFHNFATIYRRGTTSISLEYDPASPTGGIIGLSTADKAAKGFNLVPFVVNRCSTCASPQFLSMGLNSLYESDTQGSTWTSIPLKDANAGDKVRAIAYGAGSDRMVIYAAYGGRIGVRDNTVVSDPVSSFSGIKLGLPLQTSANLSDQIFDIVINPDDWHVAYASSFSNVYRTTDGGVSWHIISSNLPTLGNYRTIEIYNPTAAIDDEILIVGGEGGVVATHEPRTESPRWYVVGSGLPRVQVNDLHSEVDKNGKEFLYVGTFGRGVWRLDNPAAALQNIVVVTGDENASNKNDTFTLVRNPADTSLVDVKVNGVVEKTVPLTLIRGILINEGQGSDTLIVDNSFGVVGNYIRENPNQPFIAFLDNSTADLDALQVQGIDSATAARQLFDTSGNAVVVITNVQAGESTTIGVVNVESTPNPFGGDISGGATPSVDAPKKAALGIKNLNKTFAQLSTKEPQGKLPITRAALGAKLTDKQPIGLPISEEEAGGEAVLEESLGGDGSRTLFDRLFGRDDGTSILDDFGTTITNVDEMRDAFDALDDQDNNVSSTVQSDGTVLFDVRIEKSLSGDTKLETSFLQNRIDVEGVAHVTGTMHAHFVIGIDSAGFFLQTESTDTDDFPEIVFDHLTGDVDGSARIGFLEVDLEESDLAFDPTVQYTVDIHDPGTKGDVDGKLRLEEFDSSLPDALVTTNLTHGTSTQVVDLKIEGRFDVARFDAPLLEGIQLDLSWPDITDLSEGSITPHISGTGQALLNFLNTNGDDIRNAVLSVADAIQQSTGTDVLATKIPVINKSIREIIDRAPEALTVTGATFRSVTFNSADSQVNDSSGGTRRFELLGGNLDPIGSGIQVGDTVDYVLQATNSKATATVAAVLSGSLVLELDSDINPAPKSPSFTIHRSGSLFSSFGGFLTRDFQLPTLQDLVESLELTTGIDLFESVSFVGTPGTPDFAVQIPITFDPAPKSFRFPLDFAASANGLKLDASTTVEVVIDPKFQFTIGVRLADSPNPNSPLSLTDRVYVVASSDDTPPVGSDPQPTGVPIVTLNVTARLNDPDVKGTVGFLDVRLTEDRAANAPTDNPNTPVDEDGNKGIQVQLIATADLKDHDALPNDQKISLHDLVTDPLHMFGFDVDGALDIDGLKLVASVGGTVTLLDARLTLDGDSGVAAPGHIENFSDLGQVISQIQFANYADYSRFQNISVADVLAALELLIAKLQATGHGGVFDVPIPVINRSVSDLIDLGQVYFDAVGQPSSDSTIASAKKLQDFLNSKLGSTVNPSPVVVTVASDAIRFRLNVARGFAHTLPLSFSATTSGAAVTGDANLQFTACGTLNLTLGILSAPNLSMEQRFFIDTNTGSASGITVDLRASAGFNSSPQCGGVTVENQNAIDLDASVGPLALHVEDARLLANLHLAGNLQTTATDKLIRIGNLGATSITPTFSGSIQGLVPLDGDNNGIVASNPAQLSTSDALVKFGGTFSGASNPGVNILVNPTAGNLPSPQNPADPIPDNSLPSGQVRIEAHKVTDLISSSFLNLGTLIEGLERFLDWADRVLGRDFLDRKIPFIGKSIHDGLNFLQSDQPSANTLRNVIQTLIDQRLGTGGTDSLGANQTTSAVDAAVEHIRAVLAAIPNMHPVPGMDNNQDGIVDGKDIGVTQKSGGETTGATFRFQYTPSFDVSRPFDLGLDFFKLQAAASGVVSFHGNLALTLGFGINKTEGFFLITNLPAPEFALSGGVAATGQFAAKLGFLDVNAVLNTGTNVSTSFTADITDNNADNKLSLNELLNFSLLPTLVKDTDLHLNVEAHLLASLSTAINPQLPSLSSDLVLHWGIADASQSDGFRSFDLLHLNGQNIVPTIALQNITLDVGSFITNVVKPIFVKIQESGIIPPKLKEFLDHPIVLLNRTPKDLLEELINADPNPQRKQLFQLLLDTTLLLTEAVSNVTSANQHSLKINFGNITVSQSPTDPNASVPTAVSDATKPEVKETNSGSTQSDGKLVDKKVAGGTKEIPGSGLPFVGTFLEKLGNMGIFFPFLRIANLSQLIVGNDIDLVLIDLPELKIEKTFNISFPLLGGGIGDIASIEINAFLGGGFTFTAHVAGGFDTSGIHKGNFVNGFYLGDFDPNSGTASLGGQIDPSDKERPEIQFSGFVQAGVEGVVEVIGFDVGRIDGYFKIQADINVDLNDDNEINGVAPPCDLRTAQERHDGKLHVDELSTIANSHGGKLLSALEMDGEVFAELGAHITVLNGLLYDKHLYKRFDLIDFAGTQFPVTCTGTGGGSGGGGSGGSGPTCNGSLGQPVLNNNGLFDITISPQDLAESDPDQILANVADLDGLAFNGGGINTYDPSGFTIGNIVGGFSFSNPTNVTTFSAQGVQPGMGVAFQRNGVNQFGVVTNVTGTTFDIATINTGGTIPVGATPPTATSIQVYSPAESIVIEQAGQVSIFGPTGCGPNNIAGTSAVNGITTGNNPLGLGPGNNSFVATPNVHLPIFINGGLGNDTIIGGSGSSILIGGPGDDRLEAGNFPFVLGGGRGVTLLGGDGNDRLSGGRGSDTILGGNGDDILRDENGDFAATIRPSGNDIVIGGGGKDVVLSRDGDDLLVGDYDAVYEPRPTSTSQRQEDEDIIKRSGSGTSAVFGDNHGSTTTEPGVKPDPDRPTKDQVSVADPQVNVFAEPGDSIRGTPTLRINANDKPFTITSSSITVSGAKPIVYSADQTVFVSGGAGGATIIGSIGNDSWTLSASGTATQIQFAQNIPLTISTLSKLTFAAGAGDDTATIDFQNGNPIPVGGIVFDGEASTSNNDAIRVRGTSSLLTTFAVSGTSSRSGTLSLGTSKVELRNTSLVELIQAQSLTWRTPAGIDVVGLSSTTASNRQAATLITAKANLARTKVVFNSVRDVIVDAGTLDASTDNDQVFINAGSVSAAGLQNLTIQTGAGSDSLSLSDASLTLPVAGGVYRFDGGAGTDTLNVTADTDFTLNGDSQALSFGGGNLALTNLAGETVKLTGGAAANRFTLVNWTGSATLDGGLNQDTLSLTTKGGNITTVDNLTLSGTVTGTASSVPATIQGSLTLPAGTTTFNVADGTANPDVRIDAIISGTGNLTKSGTGTLQLRGANSFTGTALASAGALAIDGIQSSSAASVSLGSISGVGTVKGLRATGGTVKPGSPTGRMTLQGDLVLASATTFQAELNGTVEGRTSGGFDSVSVIGAVNLGGSQLVTTVGFSSTPGNTYKIIDNDGRDLVVGTFAGLAEGATFTANGFLFRISYIGDTGNDVVLTHLKNSAPAFKDRSISQNVAEGGVATLTGTIVEPDEGDQFVLDIDWGDGSPLETQQFDPRQGLNVVLNHKYADNHRTEDQVDSYQIGLLWRDQFGAFNKDELTAQITNVVPVVTPQVLVSQSQGNRFRGLGQFSDPGTDSWLATVDYGDGSAALPLSLNARGQFDLDHTYQQSGLFQVTVTVGDDDGGVGSSTVPLRVEMIGGVPQLLWYQNPDLSIDVDNDGTVAPLDALLIIDQLNAEGAGDLSTRLAEIDLSRPHFVDVNGDNFLSPGDALSVINFLNGEVGEGELPGAIMRRFGSLTASEVVTTPKEVGDKLSVHDVDLASSHISTTKTNPLGLDTSTISSSEPTTTRIVIQRKLAAIDFVFGSEESGWGDTKSE